MKRIAVILSGSGVFDGSEIHEAVLTLHAIEKNGAKWQCFAPNIDQYHVINHVTGEPMDQTRNVLIEAARIARGQIEDLSELDPAQYDALIIPGGFGAAKNLSSFAFEGAAAKVEPSVKQACVGFHNTSKPIGFLCIAPAMIPMIFEQAIQLTIGQDPDTAAAITQMGGTHINCTVDNIAIDDHNNIITTPAYMLAESISQAASGIEKLVAEVVSRC